MAVLDKEELTELFENMPHPLLFKQDGVHVVGEFSGGDCFLRGLYVGPGKQESEGGFWIDYAGTVRLPKTGHALRLMLDECAQRHHTQEIETAIQQRGKIDPTSFDYEICACLIDEQLCLDPVNEWVMVLMYSFDHRWGNDFEGSTEFKDLYNSVIWTPEGMERPWLHIEEEKREALCQMVIDEKSDQTEKFICHHLRKL